MTRRRALAGLLAATALAAAIDGLPLFSFANSEKRWDPRRDFDIAAAMLDLTAAEREYVGTVSIRDRGYGLFLHRIAESLPEDARIVVLARSAGDDETYWFRYRAAYRLAPRPVEAWHEVDPDRLADAILIVWRADLPAGWVAFHRDGPGTLAHREAP